jgi:SagB-type dehydrogenase family enzyme
LRIPKDPEEWPEEWHTISYKTYPRFKKIKLPEVAPSADFFELVRSRKTNRGFKGKEVTLQNLSILLRYSCGIAGESTWRRAQPSGGTRYPLEVYLVLFTPTEGLLPGVYHYDVKEHQLSFLWEHVFDEKERAQFSGYEWVENASCLVVMTAVFGRNHIKYGERGYRYILLEAGHVGQGMYLCCTHLGLPCSALGGVNDSYIEQVLDVDGVSESVVYVLALG